jgi:simple sugar transport system ATP-binding protein
MKDIIKRFPGVVANDHVHLEIEEGEIHGLLGENGAGKTTLMNILSGLSSADGGSVFLYGNEVHFTNCLDAIKQGIGMVHQHFMLVPVFTVAENMVLGNEPRDKLQLDLRQARQLVNDMSQRYGLKVEPNALIRDISVGMQQRVEILKALSRGIKLLILDEPTAVLTPQEVQELYIVMRNLQQQGVTIIFITHKLQEIKEITDRVTVLRDGHHVATVRTGEVTQAELAKMMVGREVLLHVDRDNQAPGEPVLKLAGVSASSSRGLPALKNINLEVCAGEILGIAGVAGNGQTELVDVITGLRRVNSGNIFVNGKDITGYSTRDRFYAGIAHIPEDRQRRGLVMQFSLVENMLLGFEDMPPFKKGMMIDYKASEKFAEESIKTFDVRTPDSKVLARTLSGGNQQKLILAREFQREPQLMVASQPTRGLDVAAIEFVHNELLALRRQNKAVLLISMELTEILDLSDRILVIYEGEIVGHFKSGTTTPEELGLLMAGVRNTSGSYSKPEEKHSSGYSDQGG